MVPESNSTLAKAKNAKSVKLPKLIVFTVVDFWSLKQYFKKTDYLVTNGFMLISTYGAVCHVRHKRNTVKHS